MQEYNSKIADLRAKVYLEYGIQLDETTLTILHILMDQQVKLTFSHDEQLKKIMKEIEWSKRIVNFKAGQLETDFKHPVISKLDRFIMPICILLVMAAFVLLYGKFEKTKNELVEMHRSYDGSINQAMEKEHQLLDSILYHPRGGRSSK